MLSDHAALPVISVTDMDRARAFYEGTLGFTSGGDVPDGVVYRTSNGGFLVYPSAYAGTNQATAISFQLAADAFDAEVAALRGPGSSSRRSTCRARAPGPTVCSPPGA